MANFNFVNSSVICLSSILDIVSFTPDIVYCALMYPKLVVQTFCHHSCERKQLRLLFCQPLSNLFNLSMSSGHLQRDSIAANVISVHKKGNKRLASNYRPISLTSIIVKIMERIVHCHAHNFINYGSATHEKCQAAL